MAEKKSRPNKLKNLIVQENPEHTGEIIPENNLEETLFILLPKVREIIREGRDVSQSFESLAAELGISKSRFYSLYRAAKKEMLLQTEVRLGEDKRMELLSAIDDEIAKYKAERKTFKNNYDNAEKKAKEQGLSALDPVETKYFSLKPDAVVKALAQYDTLIGNGEARRSKILGIEHERKVVLDDSVKKMMDRMLDHERQQQYIAELEAVNPVDAEFTEIVSLKGEDDDE